MILMILSNKGQVEVEMEIRFPGDMKLKFGGPFSKKTLTCFQHLQFYSLIIGSILLSM